MTFGSKLISRRSAIQTLGGSLFCTLAPRLVRAVDTPRFKSNPFKLGIASGSPTASGVVLWTRLVDETLGQLAIRVRWEIASDERMRSVVRRGETYATPDWAHALHVEVEGLKPGREYWYRFFAGEHASVVGRTRTMPADTTHPRRLRFAVACCQKYENGYFSAYRHMLNDDLDLIMHVGDYIYEYETAGNNSLRFDESGETFTLDQYRARYALYKSDPDLQAAHARHPWLVTWDDHEVANDYSGEMTYDQSGADFLARRAAAYRAYYEHMPLPRGAIPNGPNMRLYAQTRFGALAQIHMLDSRQYRSPIACLGEGETNGPGANCAALFENTRTKLGKEQEAWLTDALAKSPARWNLCAWGTPLAHVDLDSGPGVAYRRDQWDGFPAARQRFLDSLAELRPSNPVIIDGDIHAFQVANINARASDLDSPLIASEFTATSITSRGVSQRALDQRRAWNPNILLSDARRRGYLLLEFSRERALAELVTVDTIRQPQSERGVLARFIVENGRPGPIPA